MVTPSPTPRPTIRHDFYVDDSGSDASDGAVDAPWRTLQHAVDNVPAGAMLHVRSGTYAPFTMLRSGTPAAPITIAAHPGEHPVVDGHGEATYTIHLSRVSHLVLRGLTVTGGAGERHSGGGILVEDSSDVRVVGNVARNNRAFGIRLIRAQDVIVEGNDVFGNAVGIQVYRAGDGVVVHDNDIHHNNQMMVATPDIDGDDAGGEGVAIVSSTGNVVVEGNRLWGNRAVSPDYGYDGGAFSIYASSNWTIRGNVMWDNRNVLETGTDPARTDCAGGTFARNLAYGPASIDRSVGLVLRCASDTLVANNTLVALDDFVFSVSHQSGQFGGSVDGLRIVNNVVSVSAATIHALQAAASSLVELDYNLLHTTGSAATASIDEVVIQTLDEFIAGTGHEAHGLDEDPRFLPDPADGYLLDPGSPAVDSGIELPGITDGYDGDAPDRGYAEQRRP